MHEIRNSLEALNNLLYLGLETADENRKRLCESSRTKLGDWKVPGWSTLSSRHRSLLVDISGNPPLHVRGCLLLIFLALLVRVFFLG